MAGDLDRYDSGAQPESLPRHSADGLCYTRGDVGCCLCARVGNLGGVLRLGDVDDRQPRSLDTITATQLLPVVSTIVAAAAGSKTAYVLTHPQLQLGTMITCYVLCGIGVPLAIMIMVMYYTRLALHKMPPREVIVSSFLPIGPFGMGGFGILNLGKLAKEVFPKTETLNDPMAGSIAYVLGFFVALIMWGMGLIWFTFALAKIFRSRPFPFNMGWWGLTFPLGVFSISTILIGEELPSRFFGVLGTIFGTAVIALCCLIFFGTVRGAWTREMFHAPCLGNLNHEEPVVERASGVEEKEVGGILTHRPQRSNGRG
jgi:tellurite resistance protein TehA-like permease